MTEWIAVRRQPTRLDACTIDAAGAYPVTAAATAVLATR
jgi:hypothetical protein